MSGLAALKARVQAIRAQTQDLAPAFLRASMVLLASAQYRIRSKNGGAWPPEAIPNSQGTLLNRTGALMRSLTIGAYGNLYTTIDGGVRVGTNLRTPDDSYSIGEIMQYGTGPIKPKGKFLAFEINGHKIFSRGTKGIPPRRFLFVSDQDAEKAKNVFASYVMRGI